MKTKTRNEGFTAHMKPCETFPKLGGGIGFIWDFKKEGRFQGFIALLTEGMKPSFETFLPCFLEAENEGFMPPVKACETFPNFHQKGGT